MLVINDFTVLNDPIMAIALLQQYH